jgi:hypothetical protein
MNAPIGGPVTLPVRNQVLMGSKPKVGGIIGGREVPSIATDFLLPAAAQINYGYPGKIKGHHGDTENMEKTASRNKCDPRAPDGSAIQRSEETD